MVLTENEVIVARYKVIRQLNEGGMSYIYLASDIRLNGRLVVLKVLKTSGDESVRLLQQEALALTELNHPNLPIIYDFISIHVGYGIIVMEYVEGKELVSLSAQLSMKEKLYVLEQIASALSYLHEQPIPIVHCDVKPSNIIVDERLHVKVIDFGISTFVYSTIQSADYPIYGTPLYAAPELIEGQHIDTKVDLYSFAVLVLTLWNREHELITSESLNIEHFVAQQFRHEPTLLKQILLSGLQSNPKNRTLTFKTIANQLNKLSHELVEQHHSRSGTDIKKQTTYKVSVVCMSLNRASGSTTIALNLAQEWARIGEEVAYIELEDVYANVHRSYLQAYIPPEKSDEHNSYESVREGKLQCYFIRESISQNSGYLFQNLLQLLKTIDAERIILDLSHSLHRFELLRYLESVDQLIVITSPDIYIMNEQEIINGINYLKAFEGSLIHVANKQFKREPNSILQPYLSINKYIELPSLNETNLIKEKYKQLWLSPKSKSTKELTRYLKRIMRFIQ